MIVGSIVESKITSKHSIDPPDRMWRCRSTVLAGAIHFNDGFPVDIRSHLSHIRVAIT